MSSYSAKLPSLRSNVPAADVPPAAESPIAAAPVQESIESLAAKMPAPVDPGALPPPVDVPQAAPVVPQAAVEAPVVAAAAPAAPAAPAGNGLQAPAETGQRQYVPIEDPNKPQFDFKERRSLLML